MIIINIIMTILFKPTNFLTILILNFTISLRVKYVYN